MAVKQVWIGSFGPYPYDDAEFMPGSTTQLQTALRTGGQLEVAEAPSAVNHVVRKEDLDAFLPTPSDVVEVETAFGQSSAAGSNATYSRGDHTHGTPASPITTQSAITDPSGGATVDAEARSAINCILAALRANGIIAT